MSHSWGLMGLQPSSPHPQLWAQDPYLNSILNLCCMLEQCWATADFQLSHHWWPAWPWTDSPAWSQNCHISLDLPVATWAMYDPKLWTDFTAWTHICLITVKLPDNLDLCLNLAWTSVLHWLDIVGWTLLSEAALLAGLSPGFPSLEELLPDGLVLKRLERKLMLS